MAAKAKRMSKAKQEEHDEYIYELCYDICTEIDQRITGFSKADQKKVMEHLEGFILNYAVND